MSAGVAPRSRISDGIARFRTVLSTTRTIRLKHRINRIHQRRGCPSVVDSNGVLVTRTLYDLLERRASPFCRMGVMKDWIWTRERKASPARETLSREQIVAAAMTILDTDGVAGLSMRKLAAKLDA